LPRQRTIARIVLVCAAVLAAGLGGCKNSAQLFEDRNEGGWFAKPVDVFAKPDWARTASDVKAAELGPKGPVGSDDLVGADGRCAAPAAAAPPAEHPVGTMAGDLAGTPMPASASPGEGSQGGQPLVAGGIALGMTECQTVQRAGLAGNVNISAGDKGERTVVLTYLSGPWPGIYRFADGRLKVIDRAPLPPEPPKAPPKKKIAKKPVKKPAGT
jgi:hypothetical protein